MVVQQTSLEAFQNINDTNKKVKQFTVYNTIKHIQPCTNMEIAKALGWEINRVTPRVFELRQKGLIVSAYRKKCNITGRKVLSWEASDFIEDYEYMEMF